MRDVDREPVYPNSDEALAEIASDYAKRSIDSYSDYGVGAALLVRYGEDNWKTYAGFNINLSGFQTKIHAEQLAVYQVLLDVGSSKVGDEMIEAELVKLITVTSEDDMAVRCGHCIQTYHAVCKYFDQNPSGLDYIAAKGSLVEGPRGPEGVHWTFDRYTLAELLPSTYIDKR